MATAARCCVRCLVTRGPHAGASVVVCRAEATTATPLLVMGRKKLCRLRLLRDLEVSSAHAEMRLAPSAQENEEKKAEDEDSDHIEEKGAMDVVVRDVKSTNGSKLNGQPLTPLVDYALSDGDLIGVGRSSVRVRFVAHLSAETSGEHQQSKPEGASETSASARADPQALRVDENAIAEKVSDGNERSEAGSNQDVVDPAVVEPVAHEHATEGHPEAAIHVNDQQDPQTEREAVVCVGGLPQRPRRDDHDDDDAFESPKGINRRAAFSNANGTAAAGSSRHVTCMICGQWLGLLDVMEQQLHINACLDGRAPPAPESTTSTSTARNGRTSRPPKPSKKRKRRGATDPEQEQLTLAMALSKSLAGEGQQVDMQLALVRQELGHIDAQMAKLTKKRAALIRSMAKLEKKATKLRKSRVRPPAEVRVLLQLELALDAMFPHEREAIVQATETRSSTVKRRRWVYQLRHDGDDTAAPSLGLSCLSQPEPEQLSEGGDSEDRVSMWARASQRPIFDQRERQVYYNSVLLAFLPLKTPTIEQSNAQKSDDMIDKARQDEADAVVGGHNAEEWMPVPESETTDVDEDMVPDVVKRAFSNWRQDLEFLRERSVEELREALDELVRAREDGHLALLTQSQVPTDGNEQLLLDHEREEACAYMELVMRRLMGQKMQVSDRLVDPESDSIAERQQQPIIELLDDDEEAGTEKAIRSETRYRGSDIADSLESVISISDSDEGQEVEKDVVVSDQFSSSVIDGDGDQTYAMHRNPSFSVSSSASSSSSDDEGTEGNGSSAGVLVEAPTDATQAAIDVAATENASTQEVATQASIDTLLHDAGSTSPVTATSSAAVTSSDNVATSSDDDKLLLSVEDPGTTETIINTDKEKDDNHVTDGETRILEALRAHEALYECVLLLRPLPLPTLLAHLRSVGLKCSRQVVTSALDRHGITFYARTETG